MVKLILLLASVSAFASGTSPLYPPGQADSSSSAPVVISSDQLTGAIANEANQLTIIDRLDSILSEEATEAKQDIGNGLLLNIDGTLDVALSTRASEATLAAMKAEVHADLLAVQVKQDTQISHLSSIDSDFNVQLSTRASESTLDAFKTANHSDHLTTHGKLDTANASLASIDSDINVQLSTRASETTLDAFKTANHSDLLTVHSKQDTGNASLASIDSKFDVNLSTRSTESTLNGFRADNRTDLVEVQTRIGATNETAAASDISTSGLNGLIKRLLQRFTTLLSYYAADFGSSLNAIRVAAQLGNSTGQADFNSGNTSTQTLRVVPSSNWTERPTFSVISVATAIANQKSMISIYNSGGSGVVIKIREIKIINAQTTAVTGVVAEFRLHRMTNHSAGTLLATSGMDSTSALNVNVTARTGATITGESATLINRWLWSSDEWSPGTSDVESSDHAYQSLNSAFEAKQYTTPIILREGEGITIRQNTNSTAGTFDIYVLFTQE